VKMPDGVPARAESSAITLPQINVNVYQLALVIVLVAAFLTRFVRLGTPPEFYFDETYFPDRPGDIQRRSPGVEFYGHENTHPPLSKPSWRVAWRPSRWATVYSRPRTGNGGVDNPYAWRFFGALLAWAPSCSVASARKLFNSEIAGLAALSC
jgi:hypothetical protein